MGSLGVEGVCAQRMSLNCWSHFLVARAAQFVFVTVDEFVGEVGDAGGLAWGGGGGVDRGFRVGHGGGSGWWVRGGFHRAVVLVDLAMGLRSFRSCGTGGLGGGEGEGFAQRL